MTQHAIDIEHAATPSLPRRLAAILYDTVLVIAVCIAGFAIVYIPMAQISGSTDIGGNPLFTLYLGLLAVSFHLWFWTHGGQTLGMRAWRIRVINDQGEAPSLQQALLRYAVACLSLAAFGIGFLWSLFDEQGRTWHDILSGTRLVLTEKK